MNLIIFYSICLIIAICLYVWLFITDTKKSLCQHLMLLSIILCNGGLLAVSFSDNLPQAILANSITHMGLVYEPFLYFLVMCEVCHIRIERRFLVPMGIVQGLIFALSLTAGFSDIYYSSLSLVCDKAGSYLVKGIGPLFLLFPISFVLYFLAAIILGIRSKRRNAISSRQFANIWVNTAIAVVIYTASLIITAHIDSIAISFIFVAIGMMNAVYSSNLYTVYENRDVIDEQISSIGLLSFDSSIRFMGCNEYAKVIFKELSKIRLGRQITDAGEDLSEVVSMLTLFAGYSEEIKARMQYEKNLTLKTPDNTYDYVIRPIYNYRHKCEGYIVILRDITEHHTAFDIIDKYNEKLADDVELRNSRINLMQKKTILGIAQLVESRDLSTGGHIKRTSDVVEIFAQKLLESDLGLSEHFLELVIRSAPMHDLGKIGVDDAILRKQAKFTKSEYEQMKHHSENGGRMIREILSDMEEPDFVEVAADVAHYHHERVDGSGYPDGRKGGDIPIEARIMALADVFDALVSKRCYKDSFSFDSAFNIIEAGAGTHFDKELTKIFLSCRPELEEYYNNLSQNAQ